MEILLGCGVRGRNQGVWLTVNSGGGERWLHAILFNVA